MISDNSFESLANILDKSGKIKVVFKEGITPYSIVERHEIYLPGEVKNVSLSKRIEILGYLMHEVGHILNTPTVNGIFYCSENGKMLLNLLEDILIQPVVEELFSSSRELYENILQICFSKKSHDKTYIQQKILDHCILSFTNAEQFAYCKDTMDFINSKRLLIKEQINLYVPLRTCSNAAINSNSISVILSDLEKILFDSNQEYKKNGGILKKDISEKANEIKKAWNEKNRIENTLKYNSDSRIMSMKAEIDSSLVKSRELRKELQTVNKKTDKEKYKAIKENLFKEQGIRENKKQDIENEIDDFYHEETEDHQKLIEAEEKLSLEQKKLAEISVSSCTGIRLINSEFIESEIAGFKQDTKNKLIRTLSKFIERKTSSESGSLNTKYVSEYFDKEKLFQDITIRPEIKVSIGFCLDGSGSMGKMISRDSSLALCFNSYESITNALHSISTKELSKIHYCSYVFASFHEQLKNINSKHSKETSSNARAIYSKYGKGGTRISDCLKEVVKQISKKEGKKFVFVITDGEIQDLKFVDTKKLKNKGINIVVIGIGREGGQTPAILGKASQKAVHDMRDLEGALSDQIKTILTK